MLKGAKREHKTVMEIAKFYTDAFFEDCKKLNIKTPDVVEPATNCIPEFIKMKFDKQRKKEQEKKLRNNILNEIKSDEIKEKDNNENN